MAKIKFKGNPVHTIGELPSVGSAARNFSLTSTSLEEIELNRLKGSKVILNIFPSVDTGVCAASVRRFNKEAQDIPATKVLCISLDLPFAHKRFCGAEGLENVESLSGFRNSSFGKDYGVLMTDGALAGLYSRAVVIIDETGKVIYTEQVPEITQEPDYEKAMAVIRS